MAETLLNNPVNLRFIFHPMDLRPVCDVLVNGLRERVGFLEYHADSFAEHDHIGPGCVDVVAAKGNLPGNRDMVDEVV